MGGLRGRVGAIWVPVAVLSGAAALLALDASGESLLAETSAVFVQCAIVTLFAVFPIGRSLPRWAAAVAGLEIVVELANLVSGLRLADQAWWPWHFAVTWGLLISAQVLRYSTRTSARERQQVRWVLASVLGMVLAFLVMAVLSAGGVVGDETSGAVAIALLLLPVIGFSLAVLVPGAADVDRALVSILALGGTSLLTSLAVLAASRATSHAEWATALVAVLVALPRWRIAGWLAARLVYGRRRDPLGALDYLDALLGAHHDVHEVPETIVSTIARAIGVEHVAVRSSDGLTAQTGDPAGHTEQFAVIYRGEELAVVTVSPRTGEQALTAADRAVVARVCGYAGPALDGARALSELVDARARTVLAREEERKNLRSFLHDDLAPTFSQRGVGLAAGVGVP